jgi:hypothetical protein
MKDLGAEFTKRFDIDAFDTSELDESPLQGFVRFADGDGVLSPVGKTNHAVMVEDEKLSYLDISDSYWQEEKMYAKDKVFYLKGFIVKEKLMTIFLQKLLKRGLKYILLIAPVTEKEKTYPAGVYKISEQGADNNVDKQILYDEGVRSLKDKGILIGISPDDFKKII